MDANTLAAITVVCITIMVVANAYITWRRFHE